MKFSFLARTVCLSAIACTVSAGPKASKPFGVVSTGDTALAIEIDAGGALAAEGPVPLSQATSVDSTLDAPLLRDIQMLNDILEDIVEKENPRVHKLYHELRQQGLDRAANSGNTAALDKMIKLSAKLTADEALGIMRTFTLALNLINAAETHHRLRSMKANEMSLMTENIDVGPLPLTDDSMRGTIDSVLEKGLATKEEIYDQLLKQNVEIVLTAHPTEVNRKTLLRKFRRITETLAYLERSDLHPYEKSEGMSRLKRIIASIWGSDEIRRQKPTPQKEAAGGNAIIETVLWDAVPAYLRKLDAQCQISLGRRLPVETVPIRFASWIGGDRDGNPNVTPEVTREVVAHQRLRAAKLFLADMNTLYNEIAISNRFSDEMNALADTISNSFDKREKYRRVIGHLRQRLAKTVKACEKELTEITNNDQLPFAKTAGDGELDDVEPILYKAELMDPLKVMYNSLVETGYEGVADGLLVDIIRRLAAFGTTLVRLDIREESTKHLEAVDAITQYLGIGSYKLWDEEAKISFLQAELAGKRPLFRTRDMDKMGLDAGVLKTLRVFEMAATLNPEALGAYVISQAQTASDVLAVMLLQKQFGMKPDNNNMMRVVPLFETLNDLTNAPEVLDTLFKVSVYTGAVKGKQEVMVGYSDSAKDAGRLAACWAQYNSQERMVDVAAKHNIELTFFHGKGGTVGRGGNPALYRAIMSHPPNTINGRFRVTEQGEMITQNFGAPLIAERTLDIYTAAVLGEAFTKHVEPTEKWRKQMARVSIDSCADYRFLVREEPRFVPYFRQATPELELGSLNIGSRPAKRNPKGGIESLRAIPWTFAWTQTRTHLSAWLGVAAGLNSESPEDIAELKEMYSEWPWFRETIDLIAMILSKTDFSIAKNYDAQLVLGKDEKTLGEEVREKLVETRQSILEVTQQKSLADGPHAALLRASTTIRHPYVDPMNVMQAELLKRLRKLENTGEQSDELDKVRDALIVSISGIAQGMRNSG
mmetsp:Transcript_285/g.463  ORF Transcript_285/g.463 Transcript_285/m.463 type:complete len:994 (-) Transcript_285:130-3111(-)